MNDAVVIIQCDPGQEWERLLERFEGVTLLEYLVARFREADGAAAVYLFAEDAASRRDLIAEARRLRIRVLHRRLSALGGWLSLGWCCLRGKAVLRLKENSPLADVGIARAMIRKLGTSRADAVYPAGFPPGLAPYQAMAPRFMLGSALQNLKAMALSADLVQAMRHVLCGGKPAHLSMGDLAGNVSVPQSFLLSNREDLQVLAEIFGGMDLRRFGLQDAVRLFSDVDRLVPHLVQLRERSRFPHLINALLNRCEAGQGRCELRAYPVVVGLNIMPICDVDCQFCSFSPQEMDSRARVTLDQFKQLDWLKYVSELALWGGIGESLINPEFPKIFAYAVERFPHLKIGLSTIGKSLRPEISDQLVGRLSFLNVSLNAATKDTHAKIVKAGQFDRVVANLRYLMERRRAMGTSLPKVHLSMVIMRENVEEMVEFIDLAADLGVDQAVFSHYLTTTIEGKRKAGEDSSLYAHQELADEMIRKTRQRAAHLGVNVLLPLPFSTKDYHIQFSLRSDAGPSGDCLLPWTNCYLSVDERGNRQLLFCCSGMYLRTQYDIDRLDRDSFFKIWNGPVPQHFRKTTNAAGGNPLCTFCKTEDRFDPANKKIFEIDRTFGHELERLGGESALTQFLNVTRS